MGLMICQNLVRMCEGTIEVYSEGENKGSVFSFSMKMIIEGEPRIPVSNTGGTFVPSALLKPSIESEDYPEVDLRQDAFPSAQEASIEETKFQVACESDETKRLLNRDSNQSIDSLRDEKQIDEIAV